MQRAHDADSPGGRISRRGLLFLLPALAAGRATAADWPHWRGPARNGISSERGWKADWPAAGPPRVWNAQVGQGYSAPSISGGRLFIMGNQGDRDVVHCLEAASGRTLWTHAYACAAGDYGGPRATPAVREGRVYTLSREGHAFCLDTDSGRVVWQQNLRSLTNAALPKWGFAGSPLLFGTRVIYNVGGAGTALDRITGQVAWRSRGTAGYATPVAFRINSQTGVAIFTASGVVAVDPTTGRQLWSFPWNTSYDVNAADPIFTGNRFFVSSNYNKGGALVQVSGNRPRVVWQNRNMRNHFNSSVLVGDALYGNDENTLKCVDLASGEERWRHRGIGKGGLIAADGKLIVLTERGELMVVEATPQRYHELARARILRGTCWTHPVLSHGLLYCRSQQGELMCLDVR